LKVAVSSTGRTLESPVDPRFGRCPYYLIVDTETLEFEVMSNASMGSPSGAGIAAAQAVAQKGVEAIITGSFGPNAFNVLSQVGVKMVTGAGGSVRQAVESFKNGTLTSASPMGAGGSFVPGAGRGMGMGRGIGMGRGMGGGRGMYSFPQQQPMPIQPTGVVTRGEEKEMLAQQLEQLEKQLKQLKERLEELK
jgi:predicted Fe-Mo cluster-binding NifX family protein